ncbi:unnamed protein product [Linum tenue]|uniref:Glutaredoxin domain-containing protein n=2 Tax=Linum tenue TaxID=586396 RepID=A0AAV0P6U4_9ROSI|nr:unnamed protein product [Linum tenue]
MHFPHRPAVPLENHIILFSIQLCLNLLFSSWLNVFPFPYIYLHFPPPRFHTNQIQPIHCSFFSTHCSHVFYKAEMDRVFQLAAERPVVVFSKSTCCMCHTIKTLFFDFGVNPTVYELDQIPGGREIEQALARHGVAGNLVGGANEIMTLHLNGSLSAMLKRAGALWL